MWVRLRALLFSSISLASSAAAEPLVRVRAESRIELGVVHLENGMSVSGALRDELGTPLEGRTLAIEAIPLDALDTTYRTQLDTDEHGRFALELAGSAHDYRLLATFAGDETHRGVRVERRVERARADVRLELRLPDSHVIDLDEEHFAVEAMAESDAGGEQIAMRLWDETGRELAHGTTDREGRLKLRVPTSVLGPPGAGVLRIESVRDERRAEAQTEARIVRRRAVFVTLEPRGSAFEAGSALSVTGSVRTQAAPRADAPVGLFVGERHVETVVTDAEGELHAELWIDAPPGPLEITARAEGDATGAYPAAETRLVMNVTPARPVPMVWLLAATSLVLAGLGIAGRVRAQRALEAAGDEPRESFGASIRPARAQGRRDRFRVHGRALDVRNDEAIRNAEVTFIHENPEGSCALGTDEHGRFASPVLPQGRVRVRIAAPGYVATETDLEVPHRGEWTSFVVRLDNLRARALSPFRRLALRALPSARAWGIWTTREAREWILQKVPEERAQLVGLTLEVERACYGPDAPSETDVTQIEHAAHAIEARFDEPHGLPRRKDERLVR